LALGFDSDLASLLDALRDGPQSSGFCTPLLAADGAGGGFHTAAALRGRGVGAPLGGGAGLHEVVVGCRKDGGCGFLRQDVEVARSWISLRVFPHDTPLVRLAVVPPDLTGGWHCASWW
jgi:hypothetical protein